MMGSGYSTNIHFFLLSVDDGTCTSVAGLRTWGLIQSWDSETEGKKGMHVFLVQSLEWSRAGILQRMKDGFDTGVFQQKGNA